MTRTVFILARGAWPLPAVALFVALSGAASSQEVAGLPPEDAVWRWQDPGSADAFAPMPEPEPMVTCPGWLADGGRSAGHHRFGQPLEGTSWLNRPFYAGWFAGAWHGDTLIDQQVDQDTGFFSGAWLGYDHSHHWGSELRLSVFYAPISYLPEETPGDDVRTVVGDANLLYYPWGDTRWRPYASAGIGLIGFHFTDPQVLPANHTAVLLPLGAGVKYQFRRWLACRLDAKYNLAVGSDRIDAQHNWSVTGGFEFHWGTKTAASYYPW